MIQYGGNECRVTNKLDSFKEQVNFRKISGLSVEDMHIANFNNWCSIILSNVKKSFKKSIIIKPGQKSCKFFKFYHIPKDRFENFLKEKELIIIKKKEFTYEMYKNYKNKDKNIDLFDNKSIKIDYNFPSKKNLGEEIFDARERNFLCEDFFGIMDELIGQFSENPLNYIYSNFSNELGMKKISKINEQSIDILLGLSKLFLNKFIIKFRNYFLRKSYHYYIVKNKNNEIKILIVNGVFDDYEDDIDNLKKLEEYIENLNSDKFFKNFYNEAINNEGNTKTQQGGFIADNPLYYIKKGITTTIGYIEKKSIKLVSDIINKGILKKEEIDFFVANLNYIINRFFKICILKIFPVSPLLHLNENFNLDNMKNQIKIFEIEKKAVIGKKNMLIYAKNLHKNISFKKGDVIIINDKKIISNLGKRPNFIQVEDIDTIQLEIGSIKKNLFGNYEILGTLIQKQHGIVRYTVKELLKAPIKINPSKVMYHFDNLKIQKFIQKFNFIKNFFDRKNHNKNYFQIVNFETNKKIQNLDEETYNLTVELLKLKKIQNPEVLNAIKNREITLKKNEVEKMKLEKKLKKLEKNFEKEKDLVMNILILLLKSENLLNSLKLFIKNNSTFPDNEKIQKIINLFEDNKNKKNFFNNLGHFKYNIMHKLNITDDEIITKLDLLIEKSIKVINNFDANIENNKYFVKNIGKNFLSEIFIYSTTCYSEYKNCNYIKFFDFVKQGEKKKNITKNIIENKSDDESKNSPIKSSVNNSIKSPVNILFKPKNPIEKIRLDNFKRINKLNDRQLKYLINLENTENDIKFTGKICSKVCIPPKLNFIKNNMTDNCEAIIKKINGEFKLLGIKNNNDIEIIKLKNLLYESNIKKKNSKTDSEKKQIDDEINDLHKQIDNLEKPILQKTINPHELILYNVGDEIIYNDKNAGVKVSGIITNKKINKNSNASNSENNNDSYTFKLLLNNYMDIGSENKKVWEKNKTYNKGDYIFVEKNFFKLNSYISTEKYIAKKKIINSRYSPFTGEDKWEENKMYRSNSIVYFNDIYLEENEKQLIYFKCIRKHVSQQNDIKFLKYEFENFKKKIIEINKTKSNSENKTPDSLNNLTGGEKENEITNPIVSENEYFFKKFKELKGRYWEIISIGKEPWEYIKNGKKEISEVTLNEIEKIEYILKFPCHNCNKNNLIFHLNVIEFYYNLISPKLLQYKNNIKSKNETELDNDLELMFFNPITQNRFTKAEVTHIEKIFLDALENLQSKPPPVNFKEKVISNVNLKNLSTFSEMLTIASLFVPGLGQVKGVSLLLKSIKRMKQFNKGYKDMSILYKIFVSEKDSEISKKDKWLKTASALISLAGTAKGAGLIKYKNLDLLENVIPSKLEEAMHVPFIGDYLSDALHMDKISFLRSSEGIANKTSFILAKGYGVLFTKFIEKKDKHFEDIFSLKINFDIFNTHILNSKLLIEYQKNGGSLESALFKISYLNTDFKDITSNFEICDCIDNKPIFSINDKYSLRVIKPSKILSYLNKYLGDSADVMNKTLHWYIDIETNNDKKEPCIFTLGYKYNMVTKKAKIGLKVTSLESPDNIFDTCNKKDEYDANDEDYLNELLNQKNCIVGEIFKNKENKYFYRGRTAKNSKGEKYEGNLNVAQIKFLNWFLDTNKGNFIEEINKKTGNKIYHKNLPFSFFWSPQDGLKDKITKWSNDEFHSSESFVKNFHNNAEMLIKKIYEIINK